MTIESTILAIHLTGATLFAILLLAIAASILTNQARFYRQSAVAVAALTCLEITSGISLSILTSDGFLSTCAKAGVYLLLAVVTEYILLRRLNYLPTFLSR